MSFTRLFIYFFILNFSSYLNAQDPLDAMSLEDLMNLDVEVTTETKKSLREAPGIVTVITEDDIKRFGLRDLKEILEMVPGITFGQDVSGVISTINRGIWAQEGRMLVLMDGVEMNEVSYGTIQLSNHYPADHIKRIEIIRGPGSAIYGGFAEFGVINIITKDGNDINGSSVSVNYGMTENEISRRTVNFMWGKKIDKLKLSFKGTRSNSNFTDNTYTDSTGESVSLEQRSQSDSTFINLGLEYDGFYARYIKDHYETKNPILWGDLDQGGSIRRDVPKDFLTDAISIGYKNDLSENLKAHFYYKFKEQYPWYQPDITNQVQIGNSWRRLITREVVGAKLYYSFSDRMDITFGFENQNDVSNSLNDQDRTRSSNDVHGNGSRTAALNNQSIFTQLEYRSRSNTNFTIGLRQDTPDQYAETLVPRLGITKVFDKFHLKLLHARAFRAPVIENISLNENIKPELTTTSEVELGYTTKNSSITFNLFNTTVEDIIVYSFTTQENYFNYDLIETNGFEMEYKHILKNHNIRTSISYYQLSSLRNSDAFATNLDDKSTFGAPRIKLWLSDSIQIADDLDISPSITLFQDTYGKEFIDGSFEDVKFDDVVLTNLFLNRRNFYLSGLDLGIGVRNIGNTIIQFAQPYLKTGDTLSGPYPGQSREFLFRLNYSKTF